MYFLPESSQKCEYTISTTRRPAMWISEEGRVSLTPDDWIARRAIRRLFTFDSSDFYGSDFSATEIHFLSWYSSSYPSTIWWECIIRILVDEARYWASTAPTISSTPDTRDATDDPSSQTCEFLCEPSSERVSDDIYAWTIDTVCISYFWYHRIEKYEILRFTPWSPTARDIESCRICDDKVRRFIDSHIVPHLLITIRPSMYCDDERIWSDFEISSGDGEEIFPLFSCDGESIFPIEIIASSTSWAFVVERGENLLICTYPRDEFSSTSTTHECLACIGVYGDDFLLMSPSPHRLIPGFTTSWLRYFDIECSQSKCERLYSRHSIIRAKCPIIETIGHSECICSTDIAMVPHFLRDIRETPFHWDFSETIATRLEDDFEYFCSSDGFLRSESTISISRYDLLIRETSDRVLIPWIFYIRKKCSSWKCRREYEYDAEADDEAKHRRWLLSRV